MKTGALNEQDALRKLEHFPFEDIGFARLDHHRAVRCGFPEVVYGASKTPEQIAIIVDRLARQSDTVLVTRASVEAFAAVQQIAGDAIYSPIAKTIVIDRRIDPVAIGLVVVAAAGTADLPVAEEAAITARLMGARVECLVDVGVAGLHRLLPSLDLLQRARALVVVAGMEGALPSVIGGLVQRPVIAVPTSVGYGASFGGVAALLAMLNTCASGVSVVNIDNGFGAGHLAALINRPFDEPEEAP